MLPRKAVRATVWARWVGNDVGQIMCPCCDAVPINQGLSNWHAAHVIAQKHGGTLTVDNLRPICVTCNLSMTCDSLIEYCRHIPGAYERLRIPLELLKSTTGPRTDPSLTTSPTPSDDLTGPLSDDLTDPL